ncbi:Uncharacterised protein [Segatella copri]|nr:Uncharacterised protein [Segatella copri]
MYVSHSYSVPHSVQAATVDGIYFFWYRGRIYAKFLQFFLIFHCQGLKADFFCCVFQMQCFSVLLLVHDC